MFRCPVLEERLSTGGNIVTVVLLSERGRPGSHLRLTCRGQQSWQREIQRNDTNLSATPRLIGLRADRLGLLETTHCHRTGSPWYTVTVYDEHGAPRYDLTPYFAHTMSRFWVLSADTLWALGGRDRDRCGIPQTRWLTGVSLDTGSPACAARLDELGVLRQWGPDAQGWVDTYTDRWFTVTLHWRKGRPRVCYSSTAPYVQGVPRKLNVPLEQVLSRLRLDG